MECLNELLETHGVEAFETEKGWCYYLNVGDPYVTPLDAAAGFSEKIAQMPVCYQPNDRQRALPTPPSRAEAGLPEGALEIGRAHV